MYRARECSHDLLPRYPRRGRGGFSGEAIDGQRLNLATILYDKRTWAETASLSIIGRFHRFGVSECFGSDAMRPSRSWDDAAQIGRRFNNAPGKGL